MGTHRNRHCCNPGFFIAGPLDSGITTLLGYILCDPIFVDPPMLTEDYLIENHPELAAEYYDQHEHSESNHDQ